MTDYKLSNPFGPSGIWSWKQETPIAPSGEVEPIARDPVGKHSNIPRGLQLIIED